VKRTIIVNTDIGNKSFIMASSFISLIPFYMQKFTQDINILFRVLFFYKQ